MVDRVNGSVSAGQWLSGDLRYVTVTVTGAAFLAEDGTPPVLGVTNDLELVHRVLATRGTPVIFEVSTDTVLFVAYDYAAGDFPAVIVELQNEIDAIDGLSATAIVEGSFAVIDLVP